MKTTYKVITITDLEYLQVNDNQILSKFSFLADGRQLHTLVIAENDPAAIPEKIAMEKIVIHRHGITEGLQIPENSVFNSFETAHNAVLNIFNNDPQLLPAGLFGVGVHFSIYFKDGNIYQDGCLELGLNCLNPFNTHNVFASHCLDFINDVITTPLKISDNTRKGYAEFLEKYSFNDQPKIKPITAEKIALDHIILHWWEATDQYDNQTFKSFSAVNELIKNHYGSIQNLPGDHYDKLSLTLVYPGDWRYTAKFYLGSEDENPFSTENLVGDHCKNYLTSKAKNGNLEAAETLKTYLFSDPVDFPLTNTSLTIDCQSIKSKWKLS